MNAFDKAKDILDAIVVEAAAQSVDLPSLQYAQLGTPVIACPLVTVATTAPLSPFEGTGPTQCNASQVTTFQAIIARECSWTADALGIDDVTKVEEVSEVIAKDIEILWQTASNYHGYLTKSWSISWELEGGFAIVTMSLTTGIN